MSDTCECCVGIRAVVPLSEVNPLGLSALSYRAGTYADFFETMLARLSTLTIDIPSIGGTGTDTLRPLTRLTTREPSDPSIALLDAWAIVADVLTFYQERIANEGYLPTAVQRRSLLELARLIGYRPRPGVAASVKLAFTVTTGFRGTIPAGTRAQSIPAAGQNPQFFETAVPLVASDTWNALDPRLSRPQTITPATRISDGSPLVTGADVIDSLYLDGIATNLKPSDVLMFIFGPDATPSLDPPQQYLRRITDVQPQPDQKRTLVTLDVSIPAGRSAVDELQLYADKADYLFPGSGLAADVKVVLATVLENLAASKGVPALLTPILQPAIARITVQQAIAQKRGFSRLVAWTSALLSVMRQMSVSPVQAAAATDNITLKAIPTSLATSPLGGLGSIVGQLAKPPSLQPRNPLQLSKSIARSFAPEADTAPRLLAKLLPAAASNVYAALSAAATPASLVDVQVPRLRAGLFASTWPGAATVFTQGGVTTQYTPPTIDSAWGTSLTVSPIAEVPLDATYDQIKPGSWVAIDRADEDANHQQIRTTTFHRVTRLRVATVATGAPVSILPLPADTVPARAAQNIVGTGFSAKVTLLTLDPVWLSELIGDEQGDAIKNPAVLRETVVYAQTESLALTDEPLDLDVAGNSIDLAGVVDGLEAGRWVIVSGTRTDVPNVSGVTASELVMIAGVAQGAQAPGCIAFPLAAPPMQTLSYTTDANAFGDRLVVGMIPPPPTEGQPDFLSNVPLPAILNQQFCNQVELAPGVYANAYVPSEEERRGIFGAFNGLLVDPQSKIPYPNGIIPQSALATGVFAFRISSQPVHTVLGFAAPLSYQYDRGSVTVYGNVIDATHGQSTGEILGNGNAAATFGSFRLSQTPLTYLPAVTPQGTASTLTVRVNELAWHEVDDLGAAVPTQRCFVTSENDQQLTTVTFGNGVHGRRLPTGTANIKATYRYGIGQGGNVAAGQISQLATHPLGLQGVINPLPASGGANADSINQLRDNAPVAVMALDRLVSVRDYADFSRNYAGIGKAVAARLTDGTRQLVHVTIAGANDIPIDPGSDLFINLLQSLQTFGDPSLPVELAVRRTQLLVIAATVGLLPDYDWETVAPAVRAAVLARFSFSARALGQTAFQSEAVQVMQQVAGVAWVNVTTFGGVPDDITPAQLAALGRTLTALPYVQAGLARIDPNATIGTPQRIVPAQSVVMTPDIPETLILTQAG